MLKPSCWAGLGRDLLGEDRLAVSVIPILGAAGAAHHLLGWNTVYLLGGDAHEVLAAARDDVGLIAVAAHVLQQLLRRQLGEIRVRPSPPWIARARQPASHVGLELFDTHAGERGGSYLQKIVWRK